MMTAGGWRRRSASCPTSGAPLISAAARVRASRMPSLLDAQLDGRDVRVLGIGAVFTPAEARGRGHATRLLELLMDEARASGAAAAMLFSEIGTAFYERL